MEGCRDDDFARVVVMTASNPRLKILENNNSETPEPELEEIKILHSLQKSTK